MENTQTQPKVVELNSNQVSVERTLTDIQQEAFKEATAELEAFKAELETKKYFMDLTKAEIQILRGFITEDAPWKFMESLGIGEVDSQLSKSVEKNGKAFINAVTIEAVYYYLSKVEGVGKKVNSPNIGTVDVYLKLLKATNGVRNAVTADNEKLKNLEYIVACRSEGIEPEAIIPKD
jgi:hypothetical protein